MADLNDILCWFKKRLIAAGAIAGSLTAIYLALSYMDQYRIWVWPSDFRVVAGRVYEVTIPEQRRVVGSVKRALERAQAVPPAHRDSKDDKKIIDLEGDLAAEERKLMKQIEERARFAPQ